MSPSGRKTPLSSLRGGGGGVGGRERRVVGEDEEDTGALEDAVVRGVTCIVELLVVLLPPGVEEPLRRHGDALPHLDRLLHLPHHREVPHLEGQLPPAGFPSPGARGGSPRSKGQGEGQSGSAREWERTTALLSWRTAMADGVLVLQVRGTLSHISPISLSLRRPHS